MTQSRWYVRVGSRTAGPYPVAQITEMILLGRLKGAAEVSQDGETWRLIQDVSPFDEAFSDLADAQRPATGDEQDWARERALAKQRWLDERVDVAAREPDRGEGASGSLVALRHDHAETEALVAQSLHRRPTYWVGAVAFLALAGLAAAVWYGQRQTPTTLSTQLAKMANCAAPAQPGISWEGCDKRGMRLTQAGLKGARLGRVRLDGADLTGADLSYADLKGASLRSANLSGVSLVAADLTGADLSGANLGSARLDYATLQDALVDGVRFAATSLAKTVWIDGRLCSPEAVDVCQ